MVRGVTVIQGIRSIPGLLRAPAVARWLRVVGPAWVVMLADVDAPSVVTAGKGGTESGYALLLPLSLYMIAVNIGIGGVSRLPQAGEGVVSGTLKDLGFWVGVADSACKPAGIPFCS